MHENDHEGYKRNRKSTTVKVDKLVKITNKHELCYMLFGKLINQTKPKKMRMVNIFGAALCV